MAGRVTARRGSGSAVALALGLLVSTGAAAHEGSFTRVALERGRAIGRVGTTEPAAAMGRIPVRVRLVDARTGADQAGLVRVTPAAGGDPIELPGLVPRELGWFALEEPGEILLPAEGALRVEALRGLATRRSERIVRAAELGGEGLRLPLSYFYEPRAAGWLAANTHLHLKGISRAQAERYLRVVGPADDLDWLWVSYLERAGSSHLYVSNELRAPDLERLSSDQTRIGWGEELRHNFGAYDAGYGHVLLLDIPELIQPVSIGPSIAKEGSDGLPLQQGIDEARGVGGRVLWCHNAFGIEDVPNWVTGRVDAQNIYDGSWSGGYEETFYRYLDLGISAPVSTGTDWFVTDFNRVYVAEEERRSSGAFLDALSAGRSYITNGPFLELSVAGRAIGDTVSLDGPATVEVAARGIGRKDFGGLEVVHDGRVVARAESSASEGEGVFEARLAAVIAVEEPGWIALRIAPTEEKSELGGPLFGHTSAVFLEVEGRRAFDVLAARALALEIDWQGRDLPNRGVFDSEAELERVTRVYREARDRLAARLPWQHRAYVKLRSAARAVRDWLRAVLAAFRGA